MQSHHLRTEEFIQTTASFKEWLQVLGYAGTTVNSLPGMLKEFFHFLEKKSVTTLAEIQKGHTENYIAYIKTRKNNRRPGALGISHINRHIELIYKIKEYIRQTQQIEIPVIVRRIKEERKTDQVILTVEEIKQLYHVTDETPFGIRDRAMLAVYYGCGLRKSEGINLELSDILFDRKLLYVRKAKNNHERYVPVTAANIKAIEQYVYNARPLLIGEQSNETALFISERGRRLNKHSSYLRIRESAERAGITKEIGIHTLRHSIATHLLSAGMELENIALFLGHRTIDSTQIYTHILNEQ